MELCTIMSVAETLISSLQCSELRDLCSFMGFESELAHRQATVKKIKAMLVYAEANDDEELHNEARLYIDELMAVIYDADDLVDKFVTLAERKHKKHLFFSTIKVLSVAHSMCRHLPDRKHETHHLPVAYSMCQQVIGMRKKLDAIADNHDKFGFKLDSHPIRKRSREETSSYAYVHDIIGRDSDREKIIGMMLDRNVRHDVSFLSIVGMGGLGKTTLAQLIYNDERIKYEFPTRMWACVTDDDPYHLDVKAVLAKIRGSITGHYKHPDYPLDLLVHEVETLLAGKKCLLILDDVWNENRDSWLALENLLKGTSRGSWVVITTRSINTARVVGDGSLYALQGLSDADSWRLFETAAFGGIEGETKPAHLAKIGQSIVKKCANVPLAIRVAGSLLYGQGKEKWLSFASKRLTEVSPNENNILHILKFSYHQLNSSLKSCFGYCALFPKDHDIEKETLISLWTAQGYIVPLENGQSVEDAGDEYFSILLQRCFFQDVKKDEFGEIISVKLHDLVHDVALEVSKNEVCSVDCITKDLDTRIRHVSVVGYNRTLGSQTKNKMRTLLCLYWKREWSSLEALLNNWTSLRALGLRHSNFTTLPDQINKLLHLRYLDLSYNFCIKKLPKSFTKLYNLETLILTHCTNLIELPNNFCKLVKLRCLDMKHCSNMTQMPTGMGKLSRLHKLTMFAVKLMSNPGWSDLLEEFRFITEIKGHIEIKIDGHENAKYEKRNTSEGGYLINKEHLNEIKFTLISTLRLDYQEALMEDMQPHPNVERLGLDGYKGEKLPSWAREDRLTTSLPNLVVIEISGCNGLKYLPSLGKLLHLKYLKLSSLKNLKYMEENRINSRDTGSEVEIVEEESWFFPSLEVLTMSCLDKFKGWWRVDEEEEIISSSSSSKKKKKNKERTQVSPSFPLLSRLVIKSCPELASTFIVPNLKELVLKEAGEPICCSSYTYQSQSSSASDANLMLRKLVVQDVRYLKWWWLKEAVQCLTELEISGDDKMESLEEVEEVLQSCYSTSLRLLKIWQCSKLESVVKGGLEHLTSLEELEIRECPNLTLSQEGEGDDVDQPSPYPLLPRSLISLKLSYLPNLTHLPQGMQHCTSLRDISILCCEALQSLPKWMQLLTSLNQLDICSCSNELKRRCCASPPGQDWPNIRHIPFFRIV